MLKPARSVRFRFLATFGLIAIVLWTAIAFTLGAMEREAVDRANVEGRNLARSLAENVAASVRAIDLSLLDLRAEWIDNAIPFAVHVARQQEFLKPEPIIHVGVIGADGRAAWDSLPGWQGVDLSDRPYFKVHKDSGADELFIGAPVLGRVSKHWAIPFTRPIYDLHKRFAGVIGLTVPPPALERVYNDIDLGERGIIALARSDGQMLTHSRSLAEAAKISFADSQALKPDSPAYGHFRRQARTDGVDRLYAYHKVSGYPLTVFVGQAADRVFAPYYAQRATYLASGAAATALLLAFTLLLMSRRRNKEQAEQEQLRLESDLRESEEKFRLIAETIDDVVWSTDVSNQKNLYVSPAYERVWGRTVKSLRESANSFIDAIHPEDRERVVADLEVQKQGLPFDHEYRIILPNGSLRWIWDRGFPVRGATGEDVRYVGAARDITERKRMERALQGNEQRLRVLFDSFPIAVAYVDKTEHVTFANRIYRESYGELSSNSAQSLRQYIGEETYALIEPYFKRALAGEEVQFERPFVDEYGVTSVRSLHYVPDRDAAGKVVGVFSMRQDVTERKRAEEHIRQLNQDLERRVRERTAELIATIDALQAEVEERRLAEASALTLAERVKSVTRRLGEAQEVERRRLSAELHDGVCSNLAAIGLNLVLLKKQLPLTDAAAMERRLSDLIAMIDEAKNNAKDISVDLRPLLQDDRDLLSALADYGEKFEHSTGIAVKVRGASCERRLPAAEKIALFRIAQEALTNCAKHAQAKAIAIELNTEMDHSVMSISDDGVGFDFAGVNGRKPGLGLLSMQERAEAIGGLWRVESAPGSGTRVIVRVGAAAPARTAPQSDKWASRAS